MRVNTRCRAGLVLAGLVLILAGGCASTAPEEMPADSQEVIQPTRVSPSLWAVSPGEEGGGRLYLLGSIHLGLPGPLDLGPSVDRAYRESDELVVEVDLSQLGKEEALELARRYGMFEPPETLEDHVSRDTWYALDAYLLQRGIPMAPFETFRPWLAATTIGVIEFHEMGYDPKFGVDRLFIDRTQGRKPIVALETAEGQFGLLAGLPGDVQEQMLRESLARVGEFEKDALGMVSAWQNGDDAAVERLAFRTLHEDPGYEVFYERVLFERNRRMTKRMIELSADGRTRFAVLGVAHLLGDRGILADFASRGFQVERVD
jgi:uncharacterized protein YbaP (TraB family)